MDRFSLTQKGIERAVIMSVPIYRCLLATLAVCIFVSPSRAGQAAIGQRSNVTRYSSHATYVTEVGAENQVQLASACSTISHGDSCTSCTSSVGSGGLFGCGGCGGNGCSCGNCLSGCGCGCGGGLLGGLLVPSDHCFDCFISPMTNPVFFEDPRTLTEARLIYLRHQVPDAAGGGRLDLFAAQLRFALSERLSLIATKDGFVTSTNPLVDDGWADVAAGLKYNLIRNPRNQTLLSAGLTYELPVGTPRTLQGNGDGLFNLFLTGGTAIGRGHWISASGFLLPADSGAESQLWFWSNHLDRRIGNTNLYWLSELNWFHYMKAGNVGLAGVEGGDLINLGSTGVAGNDIVTGAFGMKYKPSGHTEIGVAYENPLTDRRDVMDNRLTFDWIIRY